MNIETCPTRGILPHAEVSRSWRSEQLEEGALVSHREPFAIALQLPEQRRYLDVIWKKH